MLYFPTEESNDDYEYFENIFRENGRKIILRKDVVIEAQGDFTKRLSFINKGFAKSILYGESFDQRTLVIFGPGTVFGFESVFSNRPNVASIKNYSDCEIFYMSIEKSMEIINKDVEFSIKLIKLLSNQNYYAIKKLAALSFLNVEQRLMLLLKSNYINNGKYEWFEPRFNFTHSVMSEMLGVNRCTVSKLLSEFKRRGIIKNEKNKILLSRNIFEEQNPEESF